VTEGHTTRTVAVTEGDERTERLVRVAPLAVALGVAGNALAVLLTSDRVALSALGRTDPRFLALAMGLALIPWFTNTARTTIWLRFIGHPLSPRERSASSWPARWEPR
jgi:uncharacterized membrane protein YbhN (UPF0104 family)